MRVRESHINRLLDSLNKCYATFINKKEQEVFRDIAANAMRDIVLEFALLDIPIDRSGPENTYRIVRSHYGSIIPVEQEMYLDKINLLLAKTKVDPVKNPDFVEHSKKRLKEELGHAVTNLGIHLENDEYVFDDEYKGISYYW